MEPLLGVPLSAASPPLRPAPRQRPRWTCALPWIGALGWLLILAIPSPAVANDDAAPPEVSVRQNHELWLGYHNRLRLSDAFFFHGEVHFRRRDHFIREMAQLYLRIGIGWRVSEDVEIIGGVVSPLYWAPGARREEPRLDLIVPQYRFWEQLLLRQRFGRLHLTHRFRFEQRWRRDFSEGSPFLLTYRFRYAISAYIPLNREELEPKTLFLSVNDEILMQAGRSIDFNHFEDHRIYVGLGYILSPTVEVRLGYMWTYRHDNHPFRYESRHIPRLSLYHSLDLRRSRSQGDAP